MKIRHVIGVFALLALIATGCGKLDDDDSDAAAGDGDGDSGDGDGAPQGKSTMCGSNECTATAEEVKWGAEPCCLPDDECGLEASNPSVILPDLLGLGEMIIPVSDVVNMFAGDAGVDGTDMPVVECMPKDQPGELSVDCPDAELAAMGAGLPGMMDADGGMTVDAGLPGLGDAGMMAPFQGCCRPDGYCGYQDDNTGFGCVKISQSIIGMVQGTEDVTCGD